MRPRHTYTVRTRKHEITSSVFIHRRSSKMFRKSIWGGPLSLTVRIRHCCCCCCWGRTWTPRTPWCTPRRNVVHRRQSTTKPSPCLYSLKLAGRSPSAPRSERHPAVRADSAVRRSTITACTTTRLYGCQFRGFS